MRLRSLIALPLLLALTSAMSAFAQEQVGIGDALPAINLKDQHDQSRPVSEDTRGVLLVADNAGTALAMQLIERYGPQWLSETKQVFLADIHRMPGLIARLVAIPQLREKPYPILLGKEAGDLRMFPRKKDCVTVMTANGGKISELVFACSREELQAASAS